MQLTGAQIVIECLKEQGVDTIFGYPGGTILNVYDELYKHSDEIKHVLTSHEQGASHAADGYARATGKVGVCFATSGPGATNLVTGIATAYMDSVPLVAVTCNVGVNLLGKDSFQEIDISGITMPITKYSHIVKSAEELAPALRRAFQIAKTGRPGPVLIDIAKNATAEKAEYVKEVPKIIARSTDKINQNSIEAAVEAIKKAKKPVVFVGGGAVIADAEKELKTFVEKIDAPVTDSLMGKGAFDGTDSHYMGMLGMHGTKTANLSVCDSDCLIVVGSRFSDRVIGNAKTFAKKAKIIQIDVDAAEIDKNILTDISIVGDAKSVLEILNSKLEDLKHDEWMEKVEKLKKKVPLSYDTNKLTGPYVIEEIYKETNGDAIICTEVGQHQMWAAQYYKFKKPHQLITSGGLGTMGYGLGASIGAKIACPDKTVINIAGDGCFRMNMNELATASRSGANIIEVVIDNRVLGMVRQWQTLFYERRYASTIIDDGVDYVKLAESMGAKAYKVTTKEEFNAAFKEALNADKPVLIDVIIDEDDKVFPMVAPGANIDEAFDENDLNMKAND
ncbi:MAG: biosynthetic-type acetolactate synthase large subunit [Lachnospiraceae bacterium]|nr:biosynthetic-type acetolactate synthase large subunit [Lachnospiraceae bacterium]